MTALKSYATNREWANHFRGLSAALQPQVTSAIDLSDMLRASMVFSVSAFDAFIHDLVVEGFGAIYDGARAPTDSYRQHRKNAAERFDVNKSELSRDQITTHIRERNSLVAFQSVTAISSALRSIGIENVWQTISARRSVEQSVVEGSFTAVVQRRHIIVHQADLLPVLAGFRNEVDESQAQIADSVLHSLTEDIISICGLT